MLVLVMSLVLKYPDFGPIKNLISEFGLVHLWSINEDSSTTFFMFIGLWAKKRTGPNSKIHTLKYYM